MVWYNATDRITDFLLAFAAGCGATMVIILTSEYLDKKRLEKKQIGKGMAGSISFGAICSGRFLRRALAWSSSP